MSDINEIINKEFKLEKVVLEEELAVNVGSGDLKVFSTPMLVAHMENIAKDSIKNLIDKESTTVGIKMDCDHLRASREGDIINYTSKVTSFDGKIITFEIEAKSNDKVIGKCLHKRAIVNVEKFLSKL